MATNTVTGTYGGSQTPCSVFTFTARNGATWYAVEGSSNVNCTYDQVSDGVDVEALSDHDMFTWPEGIHSEEDLERAVEA